MFVQRWPEVFFVHFSPGLHLNNCSRFRFQQKWLKILREASGRIWVHCTINFNQFIFSSFINHVWMKSSLHLVISKIKMYRKSLDCLFLFLSTSLWRNRKPRGWALLNSVQMGDFFYFSLYFLFFLGGSFFESESVLLSSSIRLRIKYGFLCKRN